MEKVPTPASLDAAFVASAFGLSLDEARNLAPELQRAVAAGEVGAAEYARRQARTDSFAASQAIEGLELAPEELAFDSLLDRLDLSPETRARLGDLYVKARLRTLRSSRVAAE